MSTVIPPYPSEFRLQMVKLVRAGRTPAEPAREFNLTAQPISNWVGNAAIDIGKPLPDKEGLSMAEREKSSWLRRQVRQLRHEHDSRQGLQPALPPLLRARPGHRRSCE